VKRINNASNSTSSERKNYQEGVLTWLRRTDINMTSLTAKLILQHTSFYQQKQMTDCACTAPQHTPQAFLSSSPLLSFLSPFLFPLSSLFSSLISSLAPGFPIYAAGCVLCVGGTEFSPQPRKKNRELTGNARGTGHFKIVVDIINSPLTPKP
jgi:hypothetical protein